MGRPTGHKKAGGRKKGTPNKKTEALMEICARKKLNLFEALLELCQDADKQIRLAAIKEACQYIYPKRKALEVSSPETAALNVNISAPSPAELTFNKLLEGVSERALSSASKKPE